MDRVTAEAVDLIGLDFLPPKSGSDPKPEKHKVIRRASKKGYWVARRINAFPGEPNRLFAGALIEEIRANAKAEGSVSKHKLCQVYGWTR